MSTTAYGPSNGATLRISPTGSVKSGVPSSGRVHPPTQPSPGGPDVGITRDGTAGGVGEAASDAGARVGTGTEDGARVSFGKASVDPDERSHATVTSARASRNGSERRGSVTIGEAYRRRVANL
jgi:hypothetical protein